ncbi:spore coat protein GerQ [Lentibacillus sediminis]|uniref:spore coat protein GerQ n=1 Tax=Lentibacillus sediminis TaxID=1940529 RepID=UPI000C1C4329|nr:spore coat protein GerQ [Lentibacillus sediminis]
MSEKQDKNYQQYASPYQTYPYYYYPTASPAYYPAYGMRQQDAQQMQQYPPQMQYPPQTQGQQEGPADNVPGMLPIEQSYIENILRLNQGKRATVYMTFENNEEWNAQVFKGVIEAAGRDHIVLSDPQTGRRYLLLMIYLDYVVFEEEINYAYPYGGNAGSYSTYAPR